MCGRASRQHFAWCVKVLSIYIAESNATDAHIYLNALRAREQEGLQISAVHNQQQCRNSANISPTPNQPTHQHTSTYPCKHTHTHKQREKEITQCSNNRTRSWQIISSICSALYTQTLATTLASCLLTMSLLICLLTSYDTYSPQCEVSVHSLVAHNA